MLCGNHFLFTFSTSPHFYSLPHLLSSPSYLQGMESVPGDLRSGFGPEEGKTVADNELSGLNGAAAAGDDFFVDELLDFSNGYSETEEQLDEPQEIVMVGAKTSPLFQEKQEVAPTDNSVISGKEDFGSLHDGEVSVQAESLESLEWLSHFVEDSISDYFLAGISPPHAKEDKPETTSTVKEQPCFVTPVQTKARTKRARAGVRVWPVMSPSFTNSTTSSSSSTSSTTSFPPSYTGQSDDSSLGSAPAKKQIRKPADRSGDGSAQLRRCSHCGVTRTPQWRAGPLGSKTLCNACGVRYKSGRLLPEYRPACSPTFSSELHSNNHRKVLEMRRQKLLETDTTGLPPPPVPNF